MFKKVGRLIDYDDAYWSQPHLTKSESQRLHDILYLRKMAASAVSLETNLIAEVFHYTSVSIVPSLIEHSQREGGI